MRENNWFYVSCRVLSMDASRFQSKTLSRPVLEIEIRPDATFQYNIEDAWYFLRVFTWFLFFFF